ncbi:AMP-binding protein [Pseudomonas monteilii]|uniref:AMP-binding protein n=1 Tax=Pseudomonas monteilii TaxID=76759 RepID=UPI003D031E50
MNDSSPSVWQPSAEDIASANVTEMMRRLGTADYDQYQARALADPLGYWRMVSDYCGIAWEKPFDAYLDDSRGAEFPSWFPGGRLNWVQSILAMAQDAHQGAVTAVIAERENGQVTRATYAELAEQVRAFAAGLEASGLKRGDRIGLLMSNGLEATVTMLAIAYMGAVAVPLFSGFGVDAIKSRLGACSAKALIVSAGFDRRGKRVDTLALVQAARVELPTVEILVVHDADGTAVLADGGLSWIQVLDLGKGHEKAAASMSPDDPFMIVYTSGTTGKPKGTVHVHGGFALKIAHDSAIHFNVKPGDVFCWPADMGWIAGSLVLCSALMRGATLVCYDGAPDFPDWSRMGRLIESHRVTHFGSAPTLIRGLAANEAVACAADTTSVRLLITAGEGIDPEHFCWFQAHFGTGRSPVINYTGGTEVSGALLSSVVIRPISPSGFNTASPGVDVTVANNAGQAVVGEPGELVVRRPFVGMTQSFWQDDERYLESYWRTIPGLWVHGDLAMFKDGSFYMLGRSDDTIKLAGKRVGPAEIEEVLLELDEISEAAAVGVKDDSKGQKLVVFLVAPGISGDYAALRQRVAAHVQARMGKPFVPAAAHFVSLLPKTRSSKVMRRVIRNLCNDMPLGDTSSLDNPAALDVIRQAINA